MAATEPPFFLGAINGLYRMGIHTLLGLYFAVFSVSALAADPPVSRGNVSITVNPTTGYYSSTNSTVRLPSGVSTAPSSASPPVVSKYSGGLQQTIPTGITIDAIKKSAPLPAVVRATTQSVKRAATGCLTSARCNVALMLAGAGLQRLFDELDWIMGDDGKVQKNADSVKSPENALNGFPSGGGPFTYTGVSSSELISHTGWDFGYGASYQISRRPDETPVGNWSRPPYGSTHRFLFCSDKYKGGFLSGYTASDGCIYQSVKPDLPVVILTDSQIESGINSNYDPEPSDWLALTPQLELDDVEITSAPTLSSNPKTTTIYDANGNPVEVQETNIWYDFDIRDNPSPSPALDLKTRQETKTYKNGQLTGTTSTTGTASAGATAAGGGGGGSNVNIDIPTDCEFMPTVCAFLDWFKKDDTPDEPDLSALIDNRDFTETYSITGGSKQCPADYEFTVDFIGRTYGLSFEPACDFASKMYYFVMAAAYIFAAYITIGASRNG